LIYDQPFGADAEYHDSTLFTNAAGNTKVEVDTQNISMLLVFNRLRTLIFMQVAYTKL
jgi:hypothetical protein